MSVTTQASTLILMRPILTRPSLCVPPKDRNRAVAQPPGGRAIATRIKPKRLTGTRYLIAALVAMLAAAAPASAAGFKRVCPSYDGGFSANQRWETSAPFRIEVSRRTVDNLARRDRFAHPTQQGVSCWIAGQVALDGLNAWTNWSSNGGTIHVQLYGMDAPTVDAGRFRCTGTSTHSGGAIETCKHGADHHAGKIVVRFTIARATNG